MIFYIIARFQNYYFLLLKEQVIITSQHAAAAAFKRFINNIKKIFVYCVLGESYNDNLANYQLTTEETDIVCLFTNFSDDTWESFDIFNFIL